MRLLALGITLITPLAVGLLVACDDDNVTGVGNTNFHAEEPFSFGVTRASRTTLRLEGISGSVDVTGSPGATLISVTGIRRVESSSVEDAEAHLPQLQVLIDSTTAEVAVRTDQPSNSAGRNYIVNYVIIIPEDFLTRIVNINGGITVQSMKSDSEIHCTNGTVFTSDVEGSTTTQVINGEIGGSLTLPSGGLANMKVTNGEIDLQIPQSTSASFAATAVNGTITLRDLALQNPTQSPTSLSGTLGAGDGMITLEIINGKIVVQGI